MLREQLSLLSPVVAILLLAVVFVLYVHYTSPRHFRIKLLLGPVLLAACAFAVPAIGARLGYGWPVDLPVSFQYLAHRTVVVGGEKRWIDVLLLSRKPLGRDARLQRIPWTPGVEKVLEQAEQMKEGPEGGEIVVEGRQAGKRSGPRGTAPEYSATRVLPQDEAPKGRPAPARPDAQPGEAPPRPRREYV